jgi:hypothetical protein
MLRTIMGGQTKENFMKLDGGSIHNSHKQYAILYLCPKHRPLSTLIFEAEYSR